tara:strand:+ start:3630 stop:4367 length:738 start_codon:yes stop_codon:yes gene_type:complete
VINSIIRQYFFKLKIFFNNSKDIRFKELCDNGYLIFHKLVPENFCNKILANNLTKEFIDEDYVSKYKLIPKNELDKIIKILNDNGILDIIKAYLGKNVVCYDNSILFLGKQTAEKESWLPHHDSKENRLKVYIFLVSTDNSNQPLDYQVGSHKTVKTWKNYLDTRFQEYPDKSKVKRVYNNKGDILIFDTHGIHSNKKLSKNFRASLVLTFESTGLLKRINHHSGSGKKEIRRLKKMFLDNFIHI